MSRYAVIPPPPPPSQSKNTFEGDGQFSGVRMKLDRDKLTVGYLARAANNRLQRGVAEPRLGTITPKYANIVPMEILGSGLFSNPNGEEMLLIATPTEVLKIKSGSYPGSVVLPEGVTLSGPIEFAQHFDKVLLHQSDGGDTLQWTGIEADSFAAIQKSNPEDTSTVLMPNPPWSVNFGNRAIFPTGPDTLGVSDLQDYTSYDPILMEFRINRGTADSIVGVYPFASNNLVVGKGHGLDVLTNFVGDLSNAGMEVLSTEVGMCARRATKMVGADLFFLSDDHQCVFRISEVIQERLQAEPVPVSDAITPIMKRVNWLAAKNAVAIVQDIYYLLAVPLDGSEVNNALLVYNTVSKEWESAPDWWHLAAGMQIDNLIHSFYFGETAAYAINHGLNAIHILGIGSDDEMPGGNFEIQHLIEVRGYATLGWNAASKRDFKRVEFSVATLRPSITITEISEGARDERLLNLSPITRNPAKYRNFDKANYNPSNDNDDFEVPGREDYSLDLTSIDFDLQEGIELEIKQRDVLRFSTKARGQYMSYRVENAQGKCDISAVLVESVGAQREPRKAA